MSNAPCKNCKDRFIDLDRGTTCHASCVLYLNYDAQNKERYAKKASEVGINEYTVNAVNKSRKYKARKSRQHKL